MIIGFLLAISPGLECHAQSVGQAPDSLRTLAPNIFIDCSECDENDFNYIRTDINFVNFVRDRFDADVYVLITGQPTGGGGSEITLEFKGQRKFEGKDDTLKYYTVKSDTYDIILSGATRMLKIGLLSYMGRTPLANYMSINYAQPSKPVEVVDKWNNWVFEISVEGSIRLKKSYRELCDNIYLSIKRITERRKLVVSGSMNYYEEKLDREGFNSLSIWRGMGSSMLYVWSLDNHWSVGGNASVYSSPYYNKELEGFAGGLVEYNIFPYSESTRRLFCFKYRQGMDYMDYYEETIFNKYNQWLNSAKISAAVKIIRPWGSITGSLSGSAYFYDLSRNRLSLNSEFSFRLIRGLSLNISSNASIIHDQIYLVKRDLSEQEILLKIREMETSFDYGLSLGVSYTFGSIYNNIVNPRMEN